MVGVTNLKKIRDVPFPFPYTHRDCRFVVVVWGLGGGSLSCCFLRVNARQDVCRSVNQQGSSLNHVSTRDRDLDVRD